MLFSFEQTLISKKILVSYVFFSGFCCCYYCSCSFYFCCGLLFFFTIIWLTSRAHEIYILFARILSIHHVWCDDLFLKICHSILSLKCYYICFWLILSVFFFIFHVKSLICFIVLHRLINNNIEMREKNSTVKPLLQLNNWTERIYRLLWQRINMFFFVKCQHLTHKNNNQAHRAKKKIYIITHYYMYNSDALNDRM